MLDVITIGTATRDVFLRSNQLKILKDPKHLKKLGFKTGEAECLSLGSKIQVEEPVFTIGGGAANAAVTFRRMGLETAALIKIGNDDPGRAIEKSLKQEKIKLITKKSIRGKSAYSTILLTPSGERTILVFRGVSDDFRVSDVPINTKVRWAYITPGEMLTTVLLKIIREIKRNGGHVALNPSGFYLSLGKKTLKPILDLIDVVIVNREEASLLTGMDYGNISGIFRKFDEIVPGIAVMTDGVKGVFVSNGKSIFRAGIFREKEILDRTGAGDAFGSGFVAGLLIHKEDIRKALLVASANATSVVEHIGAQKGILKREELKDSRWNRFSIQEEKLR